MTTAWHSTETGSREQLNSVASHKGLLPEHEPELVHRRRRQSHESSERGKKGNIYMYIIKFCGLLLEGVGEQSFRAFRVVSARATDDIVLSLVPRSRKREVEEST